MKPFDYSELFRPGDLVFDVGSHDGTGQPQAAHDLGARLVCYEPVPQFAARIPQHCPRATVEVKGLLDQPGREIISISGYSPQSSSFSREWVHKWTGGKWDQRIECEITTLDLEIARYGVPSYIAIDAECMDDRVIAGLSQPVHALCFEYHPMAEFRPVYARALDELEQLGYVLFNYVAAAPLDKWRYQFDAWVDRKTVQSALNKEPLDTKAQLWGRVFALREEWLM